MKVTRKEYVKARELSESDSFVTQCVKCHRMEEILNDVKNGWYDENIYCVFGNKRMVKEDLTAQAGKMKWR